MVYHGCFSNGTKIVPKVFVQELLWFIKSEDPEAPVLGRYSYKNCYGLSFCQTIRFELFNAYSYKNCYGLSTRDIVIDGLSWQYSYKNCYGLSRTKLTESLFNSGIRTRIVMVYLKSV